MQIQCWLLNNGHSKKLIRLKLILIEQNSPLTITWNSDPNNTNGINIHAEFLPTRYPDDSLFNEGDTSAIDNSIMVSYNESTILPAGFFSKFPKGAKIMLFVGRGNAMIVQSKSYRYLLGGFINAMEFVNIEK